MNLLIRRIAVIFLCAGLAIVLWSVAKGNQEILVLPLMFWLGVKLWPNPAEMKLRLPRPYFGTTPVAFVLLLFSTSAIWAYVFTSCLPKPVASAEIERQLGLAEEQYREGHLEEALRLFEAIAVPEVMPMQRAKNWERTCTACLGGWLRCSACECDNQPSGEYARKRG